MTLLEKGSALSDPELSSEIEKVISDDTGIAETFDDFFVNIVLSLKISPRENYENTEAVTRRCSAKKMFVKVLQNSQENTCTRVSFLIKLQALACNFIKKETLVQVFPVNL